MDAYSLSVSQRGQISEARIIISGNCMRRRGFAFDRATALRILRTSVANHIKNFGAHSNVRRYGVALLRVADYYGYHLFSTVDGTDLTAGQTNNELGLGRLSPAGEIALLGSRSKPDSVNNAGAPSGSNVGCLTQADTALQIPFTRSIHAKAEGLAAQLSSISYSTSLNDPKVLASFARWRLCMSTKGYTYAAPTEAGTDIDISARPVSTQERRLAVSDVTCKTEAQILATWSGYEKQFQLAEIGRHNLELTKELHQQRDSLRIAQRAH